MLLHKLLQLPKNAKIVSICGAGGKTSLMYLLARESLATGKKTAIMTTTHIFPPREADMALWEDADESALLSLWNEGKIVCAGAYHKGLPGKFGHPGLLAYDLLQKNADAVYVEADGAARLPMKYPAVWEPVNAHHSDAVIVVAGLLALGQPIDTVCQRANLIRKDLRIGSELLGETEMAAILAAGYGRYRPTILLNQADTPELTRRAEEVKGFLLEVGIPQVVIASLFAINGGMPVYQD